MHIWWVSPDGSDTTGDGSQTYPFETIEYALTLFASGDQIRLKEGTYETAGTISVSGKDGSIFADIPGAAIISPQAITEDHACVSIKNSNRFYVYGINVIYSDIVTGDLYGIRAKDVDNFICSTCTVSDLESTAGRVYGIFGAGTGSIIECNVNNLRTGGPYLKGIYAQKIKIINCNVDNLSGSVSETIGILELSSTPPFTIINVSFVL
jgi:hypothetical protein